MISHTEGIICDMKYAVTSCPQDCVCACYRKVLLPSEHAGLCTFSCVLHCSMTVCGNIIKEVNMMSHCRIFQKRHIHNDLADKIRNCSRGLRVYARTHMFRCYAYALHCSKKEAGLKEEFLIREKREREREMSFLDTVLSLLLAQTTAFRLI